MKLPRSSLLSALMCVACVASLPAGDLVVDDLMLQDPPLTIPPVSTVFSPRLKTLWLAALARPDSETRRLAAGTISIATQRGMKGLESAIEPLREVLRTDGDAVVRRAAAQALVTLGARDAAADLAAAAHKDGLLLAIIVEPALADWNYEPYRATWLERLADSATPRALRMLALEGLETVREVQAVEDLTALVRQKDVDPQLRLAAARALGAIRDQGLAELAGEVSAEGQSTHLIARLVAANLLIRQGDAKAVELLKTLAVDPEPAVARLALERLYAIDMAAARSLARQALASPDAALRSTAAPMIVALDNVEAIGILSPLLADRNPTLRRYVASRFVEFGQREELKPAVLEASMAMLADSSWRGLEQAALVLGTLDHKPAAPRFIALLEHSRPEVMISSAWGLRKLRLPETLAAALKHAQTVSGQREGIAPDAGRQLSQLFQMFGDLRYREADSLLRRFVPKGPLDINARMSACWALGCLYENQPDNDLAGPFAERLSDVGSIPPEYPVVRHMTAIGLGRMKARGQLPVLRQFAPADSMYTFTGAACYWSIEQITGEKPPVVKPRTVGAAGWFLEPTTD